MHDRDALRLKLGRRHPVRITLRHNGKMLLDGPADNLSVSGAGFYVRPTGEKFPVRGERYGTCRITLPGRQTVFCQASVVHGKFDAETGYTLLGIEFVGLETEDERRLQRFVRGVEMASRKLARLDELERLPLAARANTPTPAATPRVTRLAERLPALSRTLSALLSGLGTWPSRALARCAGWIPSVKPLWTPRRPVAATPAIAGLPPALAALLAAKAIAGVPATGSPSKTSIAGKPTQTAALRRPTGAASPAATTSATGRKPGPLRRPETAA